MSLRSLAWLGLAVVALCALLVMLPKTEAATLTFSSATIPEGGTIHVTMTPDSTTTPPQTFNSGDKMVVTDPASCKYSASISPGPAAASLDYPGSSFTAVAGNPTSCPAASHTDLAGTQNLDHYQVSYVPNPPASQLPTIGSMSGQFKVLMTDGPSYARSQPLHVVAQGFGAGATVALQIDAPQQTALAQSTLTADSQGSVAYSYQVPKGVEDGRDIGTWIVRLASISGGSKVEDRQAFGVTATTVQATWDAATVPASIARANPVQVSGQLTYAASGGTVLMTANDIQGGQVDVVIADASGHQVQRAAAAYDQVAGRWHTTFQLDKGAATGSGFTLSWAPNQKDRFGNLITPSTTPPFAITAVSITPAFTIQTALVERAGGVAHSLTAQVVLDYPSGALVTPDDIKTASNPDATVTATLVGADGSAVPGVSLQGVSKGAGVWEFKDQQLPSDAPLGPMRIRLDPLSVNPDASPPNTVDTNTLSPFLVVSATKPKLDLSFKGTPDCVTGAPITGSLRGGDSINVCAKVSYLSGQAFVAASAQNGGRALLRIVPDGDTTRVLQADFHFDAAHDIWTAAYRPLLSDPVGTWTFVPIFSDGAGNANSTEVAFRVGLEIHTQVSSTSLNRSTDLIITAAMNLPGATDPLGGTMNFTLASPTGAVVRADSLTPIAGGRYTRTVRLPTDAPLGTYALTVRGASSKDQGQDVTLLQVNSAQIQVTSVQLAGAAVPRLGTTGLQFRLAYETGGIINQTRLTPQVSLKLSDGTGLPVAMQFNPVTQMWAGNVTPALKAALGNAHFAISGSDVAGNQLGEFLTQPVRVDPAPILVSSLSTLRQQYLRGENVTVRAVLAYSDGSLPTNLTVPASLRVGSTNLTTLSLRYNAGVGAYEAGYRIPLGATLSTPSQPWSAVIARGVAKDAGGNLGPKDDVRTTFGVAPANIAVTVPHQPARTLAIGSAVNMTFQLATPDGQRITGPLPNLKVFVVRNGQVSNTTLPVLAVGDHYVVTLEAPTGTQPGTYTLRVTGTDLDGNAITLLDSNSIEVGGTTAKASPMPVAPMLALCLLGLAALCSDRRARKL